MYGLMIASGIIHGWSVLIRNETIPARKTFLDPRYATPLTIACYYRIGGKPDISKILATKSSAACILYSE
jgi:hypothetical protein